MDTQRFRSKEVLDLLRLAYRAAGDSPDPSTQNGAVILFDKSTWEYATACNSLPVGVEDRPERLERPGKYFWIEHAERAVIHAAYRKGWDLDGKTMVCPWFACADCARAIIQSGISRVVGHQWMKDGTPGHWTDSIDAAFAMFDEAGVEVSWFDGPIPGAPPILFNGSMFDPSGDT